MIITTDAQSNPYHQDTPGHHHNPVLVRLLAAVWFAGISGFLAPTAFYLLSDERLPQDYFLFLCLPIVIAAGCGFWLGTAILDREQTKTAWRAIARGIVIAIVSYGAFGLSIAAYLVLPSEQTSLLDSLKSLLPVTMLAMLGMFFYAPILFPWIIAAIPALGAIAGWLLYRGKSRIAFLISTCLVLAGASGWYIVNRLPDPEKIPVYPHATNVQTESFHTINSGALN